MAMVVLLHLFLHAAYICVFMCVHRGDRERLYPLYRGSWYFMKSYYYYYCDYQ